MDSSIDLLAESIEYVDYPIKLSDRSSRQFRFALQDRISRRFSRRLNDARDSEGGAIVGAWGYRGISLLSSLNSANIYS